MKLIVGKQAENYLDRVAAGAALEENTAGFFITAFRPNKGHVEFEVVETIEQALKFATMKNQEMEDGLHEQALELIDELIDKYSGTSDAPHVLKALSLDDFFFQYRELFSDEDNQRIVDLLTKFEGI